MVARDVAFEPRAEYFARTRVGCVIEIRARRLDSRADVQRLTEQLLAAIGPTGRAAVICADFRRMGPLSRDVSDAWSRAMRRANGAITRSAVLLDPGNVTFNLQIERVVRCAGNPARRLFTDVGELRLFASEGLTFDEQEAVGEFFSHDE